MNFKVGQRLIAVANGADYGKPDDYYGTGECHNYSKGAKGLWCQRQILVVL